MESLKLSIIVPVYNVERYIEKCIASLLVDGCDNYEIILVNDGTKDRSIELVKENFDDHRIRIIEQKNGGLSAARNHGIAEARGEYIWCVDSDDWIETTEIPKMISLLKDIDFLYFGKYFSDSETTGRADVIELNNKADTAKELACTSFEHCAPYYIMRKAMLDENNLHFTEGILHEDSLFTPIMIMYCNKILRYNTPVYHHLERDGSITHTVSSKRIYDMIYVIKTLIAYGDTLPEELRSKWGRCIVKITNGVLSCSKLCNDKKTKKELKAFVNHNDALLYYLSHAGQKNRTMAKISKITGGRLYQTYSVLYRLKY